jgi:3-dehydroquinate synthase
MSPSENPSSIHTISLTNYEIFIGSSAADIDRILNELQPSSVILLLDEHTEELCLPRWKEQGLPVHHTITIPSGERHKSLVTCEKIWQRLFAFRADRSSVMINLGGGVIGDMGGFCASTYMRGMSFIQVPTTLLSQVDASIGGKLGIDFHGLKNSIGLFRDPTAVIVEPAFLKTLPPKELRSGYAEVIKHGLIRDAQLWQQLLAAEDWTKLNWSDIVKASLLVKKEVVKDDPFEKGVRKILNFGHTIGHAIESVMLEAGKPILHGDAIAAGMIAESYLSEKIHTLSPTDLEKISTYLLSIYGKLNLEGIGYDALEKKMIHDKKNMGSSINFSLLDHIGACSINHSASEELIRESLEYYRGL